jgi:site-specific DNA-cytosine methylase
MMNPAWPKRIGSGHHLLQLRKCAENRLFRKGNLPRFLATSNGLAFTPAFHARLTDIAVANPRHARHCAFPDDFVLVGKYAQRGSSVPPLMMKATAEVIRDKVLMVETQGSGRFS